MYSNVQFLNDTKGEPIREVTGSSASAMYSFTLNGKNGPIPQVEFIRCILDPTGTFIFDFTFSSTPDAFDAASKDLEAILDSVKFA